MKYVFLGIILVRSLAFAQWSRVPDIPGNQTVFALLSTHDTLYVATDSLFYVGASGGSEWSSKNSPVPAPDAISCLLKFRGVILAGTFQSGIFRSTNEGASWLPFSGGLSGLGSMDIGNILSRRDSLVAGTLGAGVFVTDADFSGSWSSWGDSLSAYQGDNVFSMLLVGNTVLAGAGGNGYMFRYTDAQPWWNPIAINVPRRVGQFVSGMASDGSTVVAGTNAGVYRSMDQGLSWEATNLSIPFSTIQTLLLFHGQMLFALTTTPFSSSLFASPDTGNSWQPLGVFPLPNVLAAAIVGDTLFLGRDEGLWEAPLSQLITSSPEQSEMPRDFGLHQNFPNPFNPTTVISFHLPVLSKVRLAVYDLLGREVGRLVDEVRQPGRYTVQFDGSNVASGPYFYRLQASPTEPGKGGNFTETKKLVLIR